jgi:uncharacterized protein (DUF1778 family)
MAIQNITVNFTKEDHAKVAQAARIVGVSVHQFMLNAATNRAGWILDAMERGYRGAETESVDQDS